MKIGHSLLLLFLMNGFNGYAQIKPAANKTDTLKFGNFGDTENKKPIGRVIVKSHIGKYGKGINNLFLFERWQIKDTSSIYKTFFAIDRMATNTVGLDKPNLSDIKIALKFDNPVIAVQYKFKGEVDGVTDKISKDHQLYILSIKKLFTGGFIITITSKVPVFTTITGIEGPFAFINEARDGVKLHLRVENANN